MASSPSGGVSCTNEACDSVSNYYADMNADPITLDNSPFTNIDFAAYKLCTKIKPADKILHATSCQSEQHFLVCEVNCKIGNIK